MSCRLLAAGSAHVRPSQCAQTSAALRDCLRYIHEPAAGAQGLADAQHLLASAEDRWLPRKIGKSAAAPRSRSASLYRAGKFLALDVPQDHMLMVVAHEVFGHGARFRELGDGRIGYGFDAPIPYGSGDAFTSFNGRFPISPLAILNVSASGIEAQHALADAIADTPSSAAGSTIVRPGCISNRASRG